MTARRRLLPPALVATTAAAFCAWTQLTGFAWTDYEDEAAGPLAALVRGDLGAFLHAAPAYGGSLLLRAPAAFAGDALGGELSVYRAMAVPCLLAAMVFAVVLFGLRARMLPQARWGLLIVALAAGNPITLRALDIGHPEELFGAVCCAGAVLAGLHDRRLLATVLLGVALANKAWAVIALPIVLVALAPGGRWRVAAGAVAIAAALVVPFLIAGLASGTNGVADATATTGAIFQPWQIWWPLGDTGHVVRGLDGLVKEDYRFPPGWLSGITHPLIALLGVPLALLWSRRRTEAGHDLLLLLAFAFLARCVLDPWNNVYYHLPFLMALLAWESVARARPPVFSLAAAALVWVSFEVAPGAVSPDAQSLVYLGWALPACALAACSAFGIRVRPRARPAAVALTT